MSVSDLYRIAGLIANTLSTPIPDVLAMKVSRVARLSATAIEIRKVSAPRL